MGEELGVLAGEPRDSWRGPTRFSSFPFLCLRDVGHQEGSDFPRVSELDQESDSQASCPPPIPRPPPSPTHTDTLLSCLSDGESGLTWRFSSGSSCSISSSGRLPWRRTGHLGLMGTFRLGPLILTSEALQPVGGFLASQLACGHPPGQVSPEYGPGPWGGLFKVRSLGPA